MRFYDKHILPPLSHLAMRQEQLFPYRRHAVSVATGHVLEIGIGFGLNLALFPDAVHQVIGIDPSPELLRLVVRNGRCCPTFRQEAQSQGEELTRRPP